MKSLLALIALFSLSACVQPLPSDGMVPMPQIYGQLPKNDTLERSITLGKVSVLEDAAIGGFITPENYQEAILTALLTSGMKTRSEDKAKYTLDAELIDYDSPFAFFENTITYKARYILRQTDSGRIALDETVSIPYTAKFAESPDGAQRMRIAIAKAVRENITHMLRVLASKTHKDLSGKGKKS
ncbi:MAG: hypothetical protein EAY65_00680 [Alphaproteobacteria bacterium]|nr:MAG: hypothetical protein EAY65_00680 [Alphaproteobacteria bacterium]